MYKVFYNQRTVFLSDNYNYFTSNNFGVFYKYTDNNKLKIILDIFENTEDINQLHIYNKDTAKLFEEFSSFFTIIDAAGGLVKTPENKFLIIKRRGIWDLPKGKIESDESKTEGALREVEEECGISNLEIKKLITTTYHTYTLNNKRILKRTFWYDMAHNGNAELTPQTEEEITEAKWISKSDIKEVLKNTFPSIVEVLDKGLQQ